MRSRYVVIRSLFLDVYEAPRRKVQQADVRSWSRILISNQEAQCASPSLIVDSMAAGLVLECLVRRLISTMPGSSEKVQYRVAVK